MEKHISQLLPAVISKAELPVQEYKQPRTSEEHGFELAISSTRLCHIESPIKRLDKLKEVLRYVMVLVGLRAENWPVEEEKMVILEYILEEYSGHTPEEIKLAFKMAIQGKLDLPLRDVKCYENFSCAYFTTIMESYRGWARQQIKPPPPRQREYSEKDKIQIGFDYIAYMLKVSDSVELDRLPPLKGLTKRLCPKR